ncbi:hypothetical protein QQG55_36465 [Brugia pahangi]|uniref:Ephrin RBD domain-containing protein n=1 Tax=Brugia pahangi TaxID=6280 RepID=A0A0N4TZ97_BRUPA|nr:unnamed protein product [Brugia pahangi]
MDEPRWIGGQIGAVMLLLILLTRDEELESDERYLWTSFIDVENSGKGRYVQCTRGAELHLNQTGSTVIVAIAVCVPLLSSIFTLSLNKIPRTGGTRYQRTDDPLQIFGL